MKDYGKALKILRKRAGLTQAQLAEKLNVTYQTVSKWENGINSPDIAVMENVCRLLSVPVDEYLRLASDETETAAADSNSRDDERNESMPDGSIILAPPVFADGASSVSPERASAAAGAGTVCKKPKSFAPYIILAAVLGGLVTLATFLFPVIAIVVLRGGHTVVEPEPSPTNVCTLKFDHGEFGTGKMGNDYCNYGSSIKLPDSGFIPVNGYAFAGWTFDGVSYVAGDTFDVPAAESVTFTAMWRKAVYTVRYKYGSIVFEQKFTYGEEHSMSARKIVRVGYVHTGWSCKGLSYALGEPVIDLSGKDGDIVEVAPVFMPVRYTVKFVDGDKCDYSDEYVYDGYHRLPYALYSRTGYEQTGWKVGDKTYALGEVAPDFATEADATVTVEAVFTPIGYSMEVHLMQWGAEFDGKKYDGFGGPVTVHITCEYGKDPFENRICRSDYMEFTGWTVYDWSGKVLDGDRRYINAVEGAVLRAEANWTSGEYYLTLGGGIRKPFDEKAIALKGAERYTLPLVETLIDEQRKDNITGYRFGGWSRGDGATAQRYSDGDTVSDLMITGNWYSGGSYDKPFVSFRAEWLPNEYTVKLDANGGEGDAASVKCKYDEERALPLNAYVKDGYVFAGWEWNGDLYADGATVRNLTTEHGGEITFAAKWIQSYSGKGTAAEPYAIATYAELERLCSLVGCDGGMSVAHYRLTADIDCGGKALKAIGTDKKPFRGVFDGDGHVIKNVAFAAAEKAYSNHFDYKGLFGSVTGGRLLNVGIENYTIDDGGCESLYAAPLAVRYCSEFPITECYAKGVIKSNNSELLKAGGLVCDLMGLARDCYAVCELNVAYAVGSDYDKGLDAGGFASSIYCGGYADADGNSVEIKTAGAQNCYADLNARLFTNEKKYAGLGVGMFVYLSASNYSECVYNNCFAAGSIEISGIETEDESVYGVTGKFAAKLYDPVHGVTGNKFAGIFVCGNITAQNATGIEFTIDEQTETARGNLSSLAWLAENAAFGVGVWAESGDGGLPALKRFA